MGESNEALVLECDASCVDCSNIARSIRREVGSHLDVVSLRSGQMQAWREQALGENVPWAPLWFYSRTSASRHGPVGRSLPC